MDFFIDENGELEKRGYGCSFERYRKQQLFCRLKSVTGDWHNAPSFGCNLEKYMGDFLLGKNARDPSMEIIKGLICYGVINKNETYIVKNIDSSRMESYFDVYLKHQSKDEAVTKVRAEFHDFCF